MVDANRARAPFEARRCPWAETNDTMRRYHDEEWGRPVHDDRLHFEHLVLDGAQAGLSWNTILHKRENNRLAFDGFDWEKVKAYDSSKVAELLDNPGIVRNKLKILSAITNAAAFSRIRDAFGSFDAYIWSFVGGTPVQNEWTEVKALPSRTPLSDLVSKELKTRGFTFVGSTIIYAYMQASGIVNDHLLGCDARAACKMHNKTVPSPDR